MQEIKWVGMPLPTEDEIEDEVVSLIVGIMRYKKQYDRPHAKWRVGTTADTQGVLQSLGDHQPLVELSSWHRGSSQRAANEIAQYHGMEMEGSTDEDDAFIYAYTDRFPTREERMRREKEPLTVKQKKIFRAIEQYIERNERGPTKTELAKIMGHRSTTTTAGFLDILDRKNWIMVEHGRRRIELL